MSTLTWIGLNWKPLGSIAVAMVVMLFGLDARLDTQAAEVEMVRVESAAERAVLRRDVDEILDDVELIRCILVAEYQGDEPLSCLAKI